MTVSHDIHAEASLLGSILIDPVKIDDVTGILGGDSFHEPNHQQVYDVLCAMRTRGDKIDVVLVRSALEGSGAAEAVCDLDFLCGLYEIVPCTANAVYYAKIIAGHAARRALVSACDTTRLAAEDPDATVGTLLAGIQGRLDKITDCKERYKTPSLAELLEQVTFEAGDNERPGIPLPWHWLDKMVGKLKPGQLIIVGGRPAMGKTIFACSIAHFAAVNCKMPSAIISLEMTGIQIAERMLSAQSRISVSKIMGNERMTADDVGHVFRALEKLSVAPLSVAAPPSCTITELQSEARMLHERKHIKLLVVDYLQLVRGVTKQAENSRVQEVGELSRKLKAIAKELDIPVLVLSQLSRAGAGGRAPALTDLRDSGEIEQDADVVLLLHRPEYYNESDRPGEADIIIAKQRSGPTGKVVLGFDGPCMRFTNNYGAGKGADHDDDE